MKALDGFDGAHRRGLIAQRSCLELALELELLALRGRGELTLRELAAVQVDE